MDCRRGAVRSGTGRGGSTGHHRHWLTSDLESVAHAAHCLPNLPARHTSQRAIFCQVAHQLANLRVADVEPGAPVAVDRAQARPEHRGQQAFRLAAGPHATGGVEGPKAWGNVEVWRPESGTASENGVNGRRDGRSSARECVSHGWLLVTGQEPAAQAAKQGWQDVRGWQTGQGTGTPFRVSPHAPP